MSQQRAIDVLEHARVFYGMLSDYFNRLTSTADRERVKLLLCYLGEMEKERGEALLEYEKSAPAPLMNTWFKCGADKATDDCFNPDALLIDMDVDEVVQETIRLENCLSELYREMVLRAQTNDSRKLFETLLESNQKHIRNLVRDTEHLEDL